MEQALTRVARKARPAVVHVEVVKGETWAPPLQELLTRIEADPPASDVADSRATGSAVIVSRDGRVLTNHHVVDGALDVHVVLADQRRFKAEVVGSDARTDVAVLRIDGAGPFPWLPIGDSDRVAVGQPVLAVGSPFDFQSTVTVGIVSAKGRRGLDRAEIQDYIQTDAAVNPGNSGGPLLDLEGRVIGINTAIYSQGADQNSGISFAIPSNMAQRIARALEDEGRVRRASVGVETSDAAGIDGDPSVRGASVSWVVPASPGARAGLRRGDVIVAVDGEPIPSSRALRNLVAARRIGATLVFDVVRGDIRETLDVEVADEEDVGSGPSELQVEGGVIWAGLELANDTDDVRAALGVPDGRGALVVRVLPDSDGSRMGVLAGDRVTSIAGHPVRDLAELEARLAGSVGGQVVVGLDRAGRESLTVLPGR